MKLGCTCRFLDPNFGGPSLQESVEADLDEAIELYHVYGVCKEQVLIDIRVLEREYWNVLRDVSTLTMPPKAAALYKAKNPEYRNSLSTAVAIVSVTGWHISPWDAGSDRAFLCRSGSRSSWQRRSSPARNRCPLWT